MASSAMDGSTGQLSVRLCAQLVGHEGSVWHAEWDGRGNFLASCGQDQVIRLWSCTETGGQWNLTDKLCDAHKRTIRALAFSPDGLRLATAGFDGVVSVWVLLREGRGNGDIENLKPSARWRCIASLEGHENEVKHVCWSPDGKVLATCGRDKTVWLWELNPQEEDSLGRPIDDEVDFECIAVLAEHSQDVKMVVFHPSNSHLLLSASYDDTVKVWIADPSSDEEWLCFDTLTEHRSTVWAIDFDESGQYFVSVGDDLSMILWKRQKGMRYVPIQTIEKAHSRPIYSVAWKKEQHRVEEETEANDPRLMYHSKSLLATASGDRTVGFWQFDPACESITLLSKIPLVEKIEPNCIRWHPRQTLLAVAGNHGFLQVWQVEFNIQAQA